MGPEIPFKPAEDLFALLVPVLIMLVVAIALAVGAVFAAKRFGVRFGLQGGSRRVRVIERVALSRGAALLVVEYDGRRLLLGQSGDQLSLIASGETPLAPHAGKGEHEQG